MAATSTSDTTSVTSSEGPVLSLINKRIRALRKKHNRITQMEESLAQGKSLNKEQQEVLRSKPGVVALIDELEKLRSPLSTAVVEEHSLAIHNHHQKSQEQQNDMELSKETEGEQQQPQPPSESAKSEDEPPVVARGGVEDELEDLLKLLYFGSLFDVIPQSEFTSTMLTRTHERECCLTYDYVTDDATDLLGEKDLDLIAAMKGMLISRPVDFTLSHKNALQTCIQRAKLWLAKSDQPIDQRSDITYAGLREKLSKIISSDYYTTSPEMKGPADMAVFGSFQVPLQGSMMPMPVPTQVEEPVSQYQETEGNSGSLEEYETNGSNYQSAPVEEYDHQKGGDDKAVPEEYSNQQLTEEQQHEEYNDNNRSRGDAELKDDEMMQQQQQQYIPRGSSRQYQQNQQGGGRGRSGGRRGGGYPNGRGRGGSSRGGGGGYLNGRGGGQYYDHQGQGGGGGNNYYPSRNYYRGRGGRGGGSSNYYQGRGGGYADAGVTSS